MSTIEEALLKKYPEWVVLISSISADGRANIMPVGWCMIASNQPRMIAVSVERGHYTHDLLLETGQYVLAFPSLAMADDVRLTGSKSGRDTDKMAECRLRLVPADKVQARLVKGAVANFECQLRSHHPAGDHVIFVGEVVAAHVDDTAGGRLLNFGGGRFGLAENTTPPRNR